MKNKSGIMRPVCKGRGGVHVPHNKNTNHCAAIRIQPPEKVVLPMQQHIGAPCTPVVKVGDLVKIGQLIGDSDKFVSAPIHASISGKVTAIKEISYGAGRRSMAVEITSDGLMEVSESIKPPVVETKEDFLKAVRASGLVGLGGAGFPTHVKLTVPPDKKIDTLIINAAECEPFITVDYRECIDNSWNIISGVHVIKDFLNIPNVIICAEDNKPEAFKVLKAIADNSFENENEIRIMALPSKYPQGAEKVLIEAATGRRVPPGKLPSDVGCIVMNVGSTAFISRYLKTGRPLVSRSLTVDGDAVKDPKNVRVPLGISIKEVVNFCGGYKADVAKIITGGPMMGFAIDDDDTPVIKNNNAILAFGEAFAKKNGDNACIRCGRCAAACPMHLVPTQIERFTKLDTTDKLAASGINVCMECGSCTFACPAHRPLVQHMRHAKEILRREGR